VLNVHVEAERDTYSNNHREIEILGSALGSIEASHKLGVIRIVKRRK
jgi:hypothetical protein